MNSDLDSYNSHGGRFESSSTVAAPAEQDCDLADLHTTSGGSLAGLAIPTMARRRFDRSSASHRFVGTLRGSISGGSSGITAARRWRPRAWRLEARGASGD
ncbi:unnamed protein product [Lactuca virosa]|uniref:Uncharacterized protein n=1 Tax=Lactuca virosa TaxID=75947 RepID=A0AAU9NF19_9ASTR|nr:unnamed protein product [Lactuca virosa]